jgi:hypothetical protein
MVGREPFHWLAKVFHVGESVMKKLIVLLALCGCGQEASVLSNDGSKLISSCYPSTWIKCVNEACPHGYDIIICSNNGNAECLIKCK